MHIHLCVCVRVCVCVCVCVCVSCIHTHTQTYVQGGKFLGGMMNLDVILDWGEDGVYTARRVCVDEFGCDIRLGRGWCVYCTEGLCKSQIWLDIIVSLPALGHAKTLGG